MTQSNILILNENPAEIEFLSLFCNIIGKVYHTSHIKNATALLKTIDFDVLVVSSSLASYSNLKGLLKETTSIIISGDEGEGMRKIKLEWPMSFFIDYHLTPHKDHAKASFLRKLNSAAEHSRLKKKIDNLKGHIDRSEAKLKEAYSEIKSINKLIGNSIIKESQKHIAIGAKYILLQREKQKIEELLKKLYKANDVISLLDIVTDIKEIVKAKGITIYILDEHETVGKYLKPLVWDDTFLTHPDFSKHIALFDSSDFASSVAQEGIEINIAGISTDKRMSKRYVEQLKFPLKSILGVPIKHDKDIIGVLEVYNKVDFDGKEIEGFTKEDQRILRRLSEHIAIAITKLNLIQYDPLTGLLRPDPFFDKVILRLKSHHKRREEVGAYAMVMGDVDWFKNYNDRNGHEAGNQCLRELAKVLKASIREEDLLCRYGGEEFLFCLTGLNDAKQACNLTERIRKNVEKHFFEFQEFQPFKNLTMSFGVAYFTQERINSLKEITKTALTKIANEADMALAEAKKAMPPDLKPHERSEEYITKNKVRVYIKKPAKELEKVKVPSDYHEQLAKEKRKYERFYTSVLLINKKDYGPEIFNTINLSLGGARIPTESKISPSETLDLVLVLGNTATQLKADVAYSQKIGRDHPHFYSGLKFRDLTLEDKDILGNFLTTLIKKEKSRLTQ
ncbi:MAG: diguanylate cyclase [Candidatus Aminicenantes bacterium]|nr:MAG: diguanylate cyclase [Candidatus Aminicenantes bacterium]